MGGGIGARLRPNWPVDAPGQQLSEIELLSAV
jgi:hypothetical protein